MKSSEGALTFWNSLFMLKSTLTYDLKNVLQVYYKVTGKFNKKKCHSSVAFFSLHKYVLSIKEAMRPNRTGQEVSVET